MFRNLSQDKPFIYQMSQNVSSKLLFSHPEFYNQNTITHKYKTSSYLKRQTEFALSSIETGFFTTDMNNLDLNFYYYSYPILLAFSKNSGCLYLQGFFEIKELFSSDTQNFQLSIPNFSTLKTSINRTDTVFSQFVRHLNNIMIPRGCKICKFNKKM